MAPQEPPSTISLKVKVPPGYIEGGSDEFIVGSTLVTSTIGSIRHRIQQLVPSHPSPERQRLLYGGRALTDNHQTLADALNIRRDPSQTEYVLHLVVKSDGANGAPPPHQSAANTPNPPPPRANGNARMPFPQPPELPPSLGNDHARVNRETVARQMQMQMQQQQQQQMMMMQHHMGGVGMMPPFHAFGLPQEQGPYQMPVPPAVPNLPPQPPNAEAAQVQQRLFGQAVAQGQQQRAAAGMHGVSGQSDVQPQTAPPAQTDEVQATHGQPSANTGQNEVPAQGQPQSQGQQQSSLPQGPTAPNNQPLPFASHRPQQAPGRPVSGQGLHFEGVGPNGQRVQIHQQTLQFPVATMPGQHPAFGMPMMPQMPGFMPNLQVPGMQQQQQQQQPPPPPAAQRQVAARTALDQARENMAQMRRLLEEMRSSTAIPEDQRTRIANMQQRAQSVNDYIDPFRLDANRTNIARRSTSPNRFPLPSELPPSLRNWQPRPGRDASHVFPQHGSLSSNPSDVTCYLLSSPQGPQALLFSPQHGTYTSALANTAQVAGQQAPTPTIQFQAAETNQLLNPATGANSAPPIGVQGGDPAAAAAPANVQQGAQRQAQAAQDPLAPIQPILAHVWLLIRILIFAYFLLGSNMGWRRPVALLAIGLGFWLIRLGLFGDGGALRRWWDGIMRVEPARPPGRAPAQAQAQGDRQQDRGGQLVAQTPIQGQQEQTGQQANTAGQAASPAQQGANRQSMPTPEQVAQRLLNEQNQPRNEQLQRFREYVRPVERAVALFVASLWPGIGEAHVRAQEQEERRRMAEEVAAARRREEEEKVKREQEAEKKRNEDGSPGIEPAGETIAASPSSQTKGESKESCAGGT